VNWSVQTPAGSPSPYGRVSFDQSSSMTRRAISAVFLMLRVAESQDSVKPSNFGIPAPLAKTAPCRFRARIASRSRSRM